VPAGHRAETFFRFPSGPQHFFAFRQLRVWGRGRGDGWGSSGELQMYVKVGRDENNFYMYRSPLNAGSTAAAWSDLAIDMSRFVNLQKRIQTDYLAGKQQSIACTGVDSAIVVASPLPVGTVSHRFAACDDGYMVYTVDPAVTAPNLAAVQELAIGFIRAGGGPGPSTILPSDTLEMWVDDIRLDQQVNASGMAGQI
jgi:cell surface protein SprA